MSDLGAAEDAMFESFGGPERFPNLSCRWRMLLVIFSFGHWLIVSIQPRDIFKSPVSAFGEGSAPLVQVSHERGVRV